MKTFTLIALVGIITLLPGCRKAKVQATSGSPSSGTEATAPRPTAIPAVAPIARNTENGDKGGHAGFRLIDSPLLTIRVDTKKGAWRAIKSLVFTPDGKRIFAREGFVPKLFDVGAGEEQPPTGLMVQGAGRDPFATMRGWDDDALFVKYLVDERYAALQNEVRGLYTRTVYANRNPGLQGAEKVYLSPDGNTVGTYHPNSTKAPAMWNTVTGDAIKLDFVRNRSEAYGLLAFSPNGKQVVIWTSDRAGVWDLEGGNQVVTFTEVPGLGQLEGKLLFSPDGKTLAISRRYKMPLSVWDTSTWKRRPKFTGMRTEVSHWAFSPDSKMLATAEGWCPSYISIWEVATGRLVHRTERVDALSLLFSADGKLLVTGGSDDYSTTKPMHDVNVWDVGTGRVIARITERNTTVVALAANGQLLATGNVHGEIKLWDVRKGTVIPAEAPGNGTHDSPLRITAMELYKQYRVDQAAADRKYNDKWLAIKGEVVMREDSPRTHPDMILMGLRGSLTKDEQVACYFRLANDIQLQRLDDRSNPPIIGRCVGIVPSEADSHVLEVQVIECEVQPIPNEKLIPPIRLSPVPPMTKATYDKIREGMSIADVLRIAGGRGKDRMDVVPLSDKFNTIIYRHTISFKGVGEVGAHVTLVFERTVRPAVLVRKTQSGLK